MSEKFEPPVSGGGGNPTEQDACAPNGCQCRCHNPAPGITVAHLVPCCPGYTTIHDEPSTT